MDRPSKIDQGQFSIEWITQLPSDIKKNQKSHIFVFQQHYCYLLLVKEHAYGIDYYRIYFKKTPMHLRPFRIQIYVVHEGKIVDYVDDFIAFSTENSIWSIPETVFNRMVDSSSRGTFIKFLFIFNEVYGLPLQPTKSKTENNTTTTLYLDDNPCRSSILSDFSKLLEDPQRMPCDVQLKCKDLFIWVHKSVLCARSAVFAAMLKRDIGEDRSGLLEIKGMSKIIFLEFVHYLYTGTMVDLDLAKAEQLYQAGEKYAVKGLTRRCVRIFASNLTGENACGILALAVAQSDDMLKEVVTTYILEKKVYLQDDRWVPFCKSHPAVAVEVLNRFVKLHKE